MPVATLSSEALASSLDSLVESPEFARSLGERGRERVESLFSAARIVPKYEEVYERVLL